MSSESVEINATNRLGPILLLAVALLVFSVLFSKDFLYLAMTLITLVVFLRGYALLATLTLLRCSTNVRIEGRFSSKPIEYTVEIKNRSFIPIVWLELSLHYSPSLRLVHGSRAGLLMVPPKGSVTYRVVFDSRIGLHNVGPLKAVVRDPLGLFRSIEIELVKANSIEVIPVVSEAVVRRVWVLSRSTGIVKSGEPGIGVELYSVREYRPGDELRRIVWRTVATTGKFSVKDMERETYQSIIFVIEASPEMFYGPYKATPFEHAASIIASITGYLAKRGDLVSVIIASPNSILSSGKPIRGRLAYYRVLRSIAQTPYTLDYPSSEYGSLDKDSIRELLLQRTLIKLLEILPRERNLVFLFTTAGGTHYLKALANFSSKLRLLGNEVYIAIPLTVAYEVKELSPWAQAIYRVKMFNLIQYELEFARNLARHHVKVLALGPQYMPQTIVKLIEIKRSR